MFMESIFSKIISGEIPAHKIAETVDYLAFLDIQPLSRGHVLVIPKAEVDYIFDLDDENYAGLWIFARIVADGIKKAVPCKKVGIAVIGLEVPHTHIHLIPMKRVDDMNFSKPKMNPTEDELAETALLIREQLKIITED
jgi:histidine triad (HIT) family protein